MKAQLQIIWIFRLNSQCSAQKGVSSWCSRISSLGRLWTDAPAPALGADISVFVPNTPNSNFQWAFTKPLVVLEGSGTFPKRRCLRDIPKPAGNGAVEPTLELLSSWWCLSHKHRSQPPPHVSKAFDEFIFEKNLYSLHFWCPSPSSRADFHRIHLKTPASFRRRI